MPHALNPQGEVPTGHEAEGAQEPVRTPLGTEEYVTAVHRTSNLRLS